MGKRIQKLMLKDLAKKTLYLGYASENIHTQIVIDCSEVFWDYPNATYSMNIQPPRGDKYPAAQLAKDGDALVWTVTDSDLIYHGSGHIQLEFKNDDEVIKSAVGTTKIDGSIETTGDVPTPLEDWMDHAEETAHQIALTAKDEVIEQIQDAAEEARESIPADYSQLSDDVSGLKSAFSESGNDLFDNKIFTITHNGSAFNGIGDVIDITAPTAVEGWNSYVIPCSAQDVFVVWAKGGTTTYAWAFINSSGNILARSAGSATVNGVKITAPENTQYLVVCDKGGNSRVYKGELYKNRIQSDFTEVYNAIKTNSKNCLFYVGGGAKVTWSGYNESPITLSLGANNYVIIIDNAYYEILLSDIITAATSAGITVDQSNNTLTSTGFLLYFDVKTHTPKAINSMTSSAARTAISNNPVLFAAHYKSFRGGLLVDYMYEHRIETVENRVDALDVEVEAIKAVSSDVVPSYFESNLSTKIPEIIDNMNSAGQNGTTFVFITDLHWETNYKNSPALVKRVLDKTSVKNVFCGGDIINQGEKAEMSEVFLDCINHFRFVPNLGFFPIARGNHDDNSNWSSSADVATYSFNDNTIYNLYYSQFADKVTRIGSNWAFYFDQEVIKTRYIFVDTKRNGLTIDCQAIINCLNGVSSGWHVIIFMHFTLRNATTLFDGCDLLAHIVKAYNSKENGSYTGSYQTATYDFTNAVGKVDLIIGGHMHADYAMNADDTNNPSGVPIIATDTDSYRNSASIEGTVDSQCFDVVTVNYSAKTVKCVRIGRGIDRDFAY